jgi:hypothetical protein
MISASRRSKHDLGHPDDEPVPAYYCD